MEDNVLLRLNNSNILLFSSLVIFLFLFFLLILKHVALKKRHRSLKLKYYRLKKDLEWYNREQKSGISQTQQENDTLSEKIEETVSQVVELTISDHENKMDNLDDKSFGGNEILIQENIYYLPFPDKEKTFYAPEASSVPKEDTFYKIEEEKLLMYDNISNEQMNTAMNFVENHIKRVCVIQNAREPIHTKVIMISPGKVIRKEDDYLVTDKIRILYA